MIYDFVIIGGGIVGIATASELQRVNQDCSILVLEKETELALHQTGRNSGVIHAGVYYQPGSMKALFCKEGSERTLKFCEERDIPVEQCGKLIVATNDLELARLVDLEDRSRQNGLAYDRLDAAELRRREPNITGLGALYFPASAIVDYGRVARAMAEDFVSKGGEIRLSARVTAVREEADRVTIETSRGSVAGRRLVACAGLFADRVAAWCGIERDFRIVPFRGEYYRLADSRNEIVKHLIYPVPNPDLPFLGVHLTRMIGGYVTVGPNAVLSWKREGYGKLALNLSDAADVLSFPGFWKMAANHARFAIDEMMNSVFKNRYLAQCQKYCPDLSIDDLLPHPPGVRAQAVLLDGTIVHDFLFRRTRRTIHVCNAPSPAATSAMPIARAIAMRAAELAP